MTAEPGRNQPSTSARTSAMLETGPENGAAPEGLTLAPAGAAQAAGTVAPADAEDAESDELLACFGAGTLPERRFHHRDHRERQDADEDDLHVSRLSRGRA